MRTRRIGEGERALRVKGCAGYGNWKETTGLYQFWLNTKCAKVPDRHRFLPINALRCNSNSDGSSSRRTAKRPASSRYLNQGQSPPFMQKCHDRVDLSTSQLVLPLNVVRRPVRSLEIRCAGSSLIDGIHASHPFTCVSMAITPHMSISTTSDILGDGHADRMSPVCT
jgi:hypothetical protein